MEAERTGVRDVGRTVVPSRAYKYDEKERRRKGLNFESLRAIMRKLRAGEI